jgi:glyoxylase-like metal-dependent hydrolase (beta-lactamase superfamily II)
MEIRKINLAMVNVYLVYTDQTGILIDTGTPGKGTKILDEIQKCGLEPQQIELIVITHSHYDHIGSLPELKEATGASVAVHAAEAEYLKQGKSAPVKPHGKLASMLVHSSADPEKQIIDPVSPEIIVDDEYPLNDFGFNGTVLHTPGHTRGSLSVYFTDIATVFIGDLLMRTMFVFGKAGMPKIMDNAEEVIRSVKRIQDLHPGLIYASHGGIMKPRELNRLTEK